MILISKLMTTHAGNQTVTIHILPNISQRKSNQIMKFGQLTEYNKRNIFLQKSCRKCGREAGPRPIFVFQKCFICGKSERSVT